DVAIDPFEEFYYDYDPNYVSVHFLLLIVPLIIIIGLIVAVIILGVKHGKLKKMLRGQGFAIGTPQYKGTTQQPPTGMSNMPMQQPGVYPSDNYGIGTGSQPSGTHFPGSQQDSNAPETMSDGSFTEGVFSGKAEEPPKYPFAHQDYMAQPAAELSEFSEQIESTQMPSQYPDYMTQNAGYHQPNLADYDRAKAVAQQPQQGMHGYVPYPGQNSGQNIQYGQPQNFSQYQNQVLQPLEVDNYSNEPVQDGQGNQFMDSYPNQSEGYKPDQEPEYQSDQRDDSLGDTNRNASTSAANAITKESEPFTPSTQESESFSSAE
ncbi:MAG: hypothetical protein GX239_05615, partial [Clostridiaceae bacterium]|nr:hypothetical protein [Clostridiaceae bacterium]